MIQIDMILMKIYNKLRNVYLTRKYGFRGNKIKYGKNVSILNPQYISVGNKVFFDDNVELCVQKTISDITPRLQIGNRVRLGKFNRIGCDNNIIIEDDVLCAPNVHISDRNHGYEDIYTPINLQPITTKGAIVIGAETWLGFGCQIMSGVKIGKHCIIAAGSVVTKNVPDYSVVGGNPAKILRYYNEETKQWEKIH